MAKTSDFRNGMVLQMENGLFSIEEFQHVKPGKGNAFVRTKLKNLANGAVIPKTFRAGEKVEEVRIENHEMQYLYNDGDNYYVMNAETYEQMSLPTNLADDAKDWLKEGIMVEVQFHGDTPIGLRLPFFMELEITHCEPGIKGDTVSGATKPATLETGVTVQVPLFVNQGDVIRVDTRTAKYLERVKTV